MIRHRALFIAGALPEPAAAMRGWLSAGHEIAALWIGHLSLRGMMNRDARLAWLAPQWSTAAVARRHGIPVREVPRLATWEGRMEAVRETGANVLISAYFPFLVPPDMLEYFGGRAVNLHPAPLPRYRGPTPAYAMILDRAILTEACMTLHVMEPGFDTGPIIARQPIAFPADWSMVRLSLAGARAARELTATALPAYLDGRISAEPQDEEKASYPRLLAADIEIGPRLDRQAVRWLCDTIGQGRMLRVSGLPEVKIVGFARDLGPKTGEKPRVGPFSVELDVADGRIRLARRRPWSSLARKAQKLLIQRSDRDTS
jgi:methionyl-tRNA formyltransferase